MQTIQDKSDFDQIISQKGEHIFYVHSPWAGQSHFGKGKLEKLKEKFPDFELTIILNDMNTDSFIYQWLANKDFNYLIQDNRPSGGPWIHGMGELFMVEDDLLRWFRRATMHIDEDELKSLLKAS